MGIHLQINVTNSLRSATFLLLVTLKLGYLQICYTHHKKSIFTNLLLFFAA